MNSTNVAGTLPSSVPTIAANGHPAGTRTRSKGGSMSPSVIIIFVILLIAIISIFCILRLVRYFCRQHSHHGSSYRLPMYRTRSIGHAAISTLAVSEHEKQKLINSLPVFTLASSMAKLHNSSLSADCAVCCDPFLPDAELRLLPACCHAFHKGCVDTWLQSNPSCPLCRSSIPLPYLPLLNNLSSGSFSLELGNVSFRRSEPNSQIQNQIRPIPPPVRTYSLESHDYCIEEEVEIHPIGVTKSLEKKLKRKNSGTSHDLAPPPPPPPPPPLTRPPPQLPPIPIQTLTREEPVRGWLGEFLDRLSSVSSSFNSTRFPSQRLSSRWSGRWSQRSSQRFDAGGGGGGLPPDTWLSELEAGRNEDTGGTLELYRWLMGV